MKKVLLLGAALASLSLRTATAQTTAKPPVTKASAAETLTNKSIIALTAAGLPADIISAKIASSACAFDVSTNGLLALKQAKVADGVLKAMMERATSGKAAPAGRAAAGRSSTAPRLPKLEIANHPYLRTGPTGVWSPLEKATSSLKTKMVAMGYGGVKILYQLPNEKSPTRLAATDSAVFLVNTFGTALPEFVLYQARPEKGNRAAVGAKAGGLSGASSGQDVLTFNVLPVGNGVFKLVPSNKLPPGEYFFAGKPVGTAMTVDAYAFGID